MKREPILVAAMAMVAILGLSSCSMDSSSGGGIISYQAYERPAKLPKDPGAVKVKVSLSKQRVYVMEDEQMLLAMPVSVGAPSTPTPTGSFRIFHKNHKHRSNKHGFASDGKTVKKTSLENKPSGWSLKGTPMPYWCEFKPSYGFHTGWVKHSPCTHDGCIRMHENLAPKFFRLVSVGTPVDISYTQPEDAKWAHMPLPPDAGPLADYSSEMYVGDGYFTRHIDPKFD